MEQAGIPIEQIIVRSSATLTAAIAMLIVASFVANRSSNNGFAGFGNALILGVSNALVLLGASLSASSLTGLILRRYFSILHYEIFAAICFVGGAAGLYAGACGSLIARNIGSSLAGEPAEKFDFYQVFRFKVSTEIAHKPHARVTHTNADWWYSTFNKAACVLLIFEIGVCLWHDAPNWFLFAVSLAIGGATIIAAGFRPTSLSPEVMKSDANAWLCILAGFGPLGLALRAMYRFELVDWRWPLIVAIGFGLPLAVMVGRQFGAAKTSPIRSIILGAFLCYSGPGSLIWSGLQFANAMSSPALPTVDHVRISSKHEQHGKSAMYWINATNPPDLNGIKDFKLDRSTYDRLNEGGDACIEVRRGSLSLRWYQVVECETHATQ
jgi:hypothetical protein